MNTFNQAADNSVVERVAVSMKERGFDVIIAADKNEALEMAKNLIPAEAEVMTGSSTTLNEIGFMDWIAKEEDGRVNLQAKVWGENDEEKRAILRREAVAANYYVASVNAVTEDGILVAVDATGSRVSAMPFAAGKLILVVGAQKITKNLEEAMTRIREHVFPLENERAQKAYGMGSTFGKWVIIEKEVAPKRITVILVNEKLGF